MGAASKSPSWHNTLSSAALRDSDSGEFVGEFVHGAKSREVVNASASRAGYMSLPLLEEVQVEGEGGGGASGGEQINQRVLARGDRSMILRLPPPPTGPPKGGGGSIEGPSIEGSLIDLSEPASVEAGTQDEWDGWGMQGLQGKQGMSGLQGAGAQEPLSHGSDGLGDWGRAAGGGRAAVGGRLNAESGEHELGLVGGRVGGALIDGEEMFGAWGDGAVTPHTHTPPSNLPVVSLGEELLGEEGGGGVRGGRDANVGVTPSSAAQERMTDEDLEALEQQLAEMRDLL